MNEDIGTHLRISTTVCFIASLVAVVVNITGLTLSVMNNYINAYGNAVVDATRTQLNSLPLMDKVPAPVVYATLQRAFDDLSMVVLKGSAEDGSDDMVLYDYLSTDDDKLMILATTMTTDNLIVGLERAEGSILYKVTLEVLPY